MEISPCISYTPDDLLRKIDDVHCLFISTSTLIDLLPTDFYLDTAHPSFKLTGLKSLSIFRTHKIALLQKSLIERALGRLDNLLIEEINRRLRLALGL